MSIGLSQLLHHHRVGRLTIGPQAASLPYKLSNGLPSKLAKLAKPTGVEVGKLGIVQAEQIENRNVDIPHGMDYLHSLLPDLIGRADDRARPNAAACQPH